MAQKNKTQQSRRLKNKKNLVVFLIASAGVIVLTVLLAVNFEIVKDLVIGISYHPSGEMSDIRESLSLTERGWRVFNASHPELQDKVAFNQNCREVENESAILGCYRDERIFIYNIVDDELPGIRELTSAHELLHAVYHRMSGSEKAKWAPILEQIYKDNSAILGSEVELYSEDQKQEELYVRIGTEIKDLPEELEKHYEEIFRDQDKIVDFYDGYITVFREVEKKQKELFDKIESLKEKISTRTSEYESGAEDLNAEINEFNECARTLNCFKSMAAFRNRRAELINRQDALNGVYEEINQMIVEYNNLIAEYNENILHGQILNIKINSSAKTEAIGD